MVRIDLVSSVPPHIQPPIAQVPSPMREGASFVPGMRKVSICGVLFIGESSS